MIRFYGVTTADFFYYGSNFSFRFVKKKTWSSFERFYIYHPSKWSMRLFFFFSRCLTIFPTRWAHEPQSFPRVRWLKRGERARVVECGGGWWGTVKGKVWLGRDDTGRNNENKTNRLHFPPIPHPLFGMCRLSFKRSPMPPQPFNPFYHYDEKDDKSLFYTRWFRIEGGCSPYGSPFSFHGAF